ncbi:MAG: Hsp20/alpha crystallin family protein [Planctomycetota bacterium]
MFRMIPFQSACATAPRNDVNRLFRDFFGESFAETSVWGPAIDVIENEDAILVRADLPGVDPKAVTISIEDGVLTLSGEKATVEEERKDAFRLERRTGSFSRSVRLPDTVDADKTEASSEHGVLTVRVPKREETKPRKIEVKVN